MRPPLHAHTHLPLHYALDTLQRLPCGCVAAVYRTQGTAAEVVSLEARGPYCVFPDHQSGRVLGLVSSTAQLGAR